MGNCGSHVNIELYQQSEDSIYNQMRLLLDLEEKELIPSGRTNEYINNNKGYINLDRFLNNAARDGDTKLTVALLKLGANANKEDEQGYTPLRVAAANGHTDVVRAILDCHVNIENANSRGYTPLHLAALNGHAETVRSLLNRGANIDCVNYDGYTPFYYAVSNNHLETVGILAFNGANADGIELTEPVEKAIAARRYQEVTALELSCHMMAHIISVPPYKETVEFSQSMQSTNDAPLSAILNLPDEILRAIPEWLDGIDCKERFSNALSYQGTDSYTLQR